MGKVNPEAMKDWRDGDVVYAQDYKREREILRTAINDNFDRLIKRFVVKNASGQTKTTANLDTALNYLQFQEGANVILDMDASTATLKISVSYGSGSVPTAALADGSVTTVKVANSAITEIKIANGAVTTNKLADGAVTTEKIADNAVNTAKIANNSVTEQKIANNAVTSGKIADQSVTASKLANNSVTTRAVADRSITEAKIQQGALDNRYYTKPETNSLLNQKTDVFGDHKGTWQGLRVEDIDPEGFNAARITALEKKLNDVDVRDLTITNRLSVIHTDQATPLHLNKVKGRTVVNLAPTFYSVLWRFHNNVVVNAPNKITLNATDNHQESVLQPIPVKSSTTYTISVSTNGRYYVRDLTNDTPFFTHTDSDGNRYMTFTTANNTTEVSIRLSNHTLGEGTYTFENIMLNEGSEPQEYVDGIKNLSGTYIKRYGKNLLPPLYQWEKVYANSVIGDPLKVVEPYKLVHIRETDFVEWLTYRFPVNPGQTYTASVFVEGTEEARLTLNAFDKDDNRILNLSRIGGDYLTVTANIPEGAVYAMVYLYGGTVEKNPVTFYNPMLNYGSEPLPFEPQNNDYLYADVELASSANGSVADVLEYRDGRYWKTRWYESVTLNSDWPWFRVNRTLAGYKQVAISAGNLTPPTVPTVATVVKYNGLIVPVGPAEAVSEVFGMAKDGYFRLNIPNADSGWGDSYTPTSDEVKAYFNGWYMLEDGKPRSEGYNGTGTKVWYPITRKDASKYPWDSSLAVIGSVPTEISQTAISDGWQPYKLQYQLAEPIIEDVTDKVEGSISLHTGDNLVEMGEAVVVREMSNPAKIGTTGYYINAKQDVSTKLSYNTRSIIQVYKNSTIFKSAIIQRYEDLDNPYAYGLSRVWIKPENFDPNAIYTVTYIAEPHTYSASVQAIDVQYFTNIKTAVDRTVQDVADLTTRVSEIPSKYASKIQEPWIEPTLLNGWSGVARYYKDELGTVHVTCDLSGGIANSGVVLFVLPEGYRPDISPSRRFVAFTNTNAPMPDIAFVRVNDDGRVSIASSEFKNPTFAFSISFRAR